MAKSTAPSTRSQVFATLETPALFVTLLLQRLGVDGLSPFILLIVIMQFVLTSHRSVLTLVPLL